MSLLDQMPYDSDGTDDSFSPDDMDFPPDVDPDSDGIFDLGDCDLTTD